MTLDRRACYAALRAKDPRHDGRFFVGVRTTGIYCRPTCPAKTAQLENMLFYRTAAEAESEGFRPCLRCRPEAAAGSPRWNGTATTVARALRLIDDGYLADHDVGELAQVLGVGDRHLRALFLEHVGAPPKALADARRLDLARDLLDGTDLPVGDVAFAAGFSSVRRFNDAVRTRYGLTPTALRAGRRAAATGPGTTLRLGYRPPLDWAWMLAWLADHAVDGLEVVDGETYSRSFRVGRVAGWLRATPEPDAHRVRVEVFAPRPVPLLPLARRVRRLFDLDADPLAVSETLRRDPALAPLVARHPGTRIPGSWDGFEAAVRTIVSQVVSLRAAARLAARLVARHGDALPPAGDGAPRALFPEPVALTRLRAAPAGLSASKARAVRALARSVARGALALDAPADHAELRRALRALPGVGEWTAELVALRSSDPDAFPATDLVLARRLAGIESDPETWRPWRGYAAHLLWRSHAPDRIPRR